VPDDTRGAVKTAGYFGHQNKSGALVGVLMTQTASEVDYRFNQQELAVAQKELKLALLFTDYSSAAYSRGKLKHAADARSKAHSLCMKATARLTISARSNDELAWYEERS
jgi:hypothetical protein